MACQGEPLRSLPPPRQGPWCPNEDAQLVELVNQYGGKHFILESIKKE